MTTDFYRAFEDRYRGTIDDTRKKQQVYIPLVRILRKVHGDKAGAIDLGCGRGEWLAILQEEGFSAAGFDLDEGMLAAARERGMIVTKQDALAGLQQLPDDSQALITAFHLVEHLPFDQVHVLVSEALRVLKPTGLLLLETPNPDNIVVAGHWFYLDPTHIKPIPSELLSFLPEFYGFSRTSVLRLHECVAAADIADASLLDVLQGASRDYAVIAQKKAPRAQLKWFDHFFGLESGVSLAALAEAYDLRHHQRMQQAEQRMQQAEQRMQQAEQRMQQAISECAAIYKSTSWRVTAPLRHISPKVRVLKHGVIGWFTYAPGSRPWRVVQRLRRLYDEKMSSASDDNRHHLPRLAYISPVPPEKTGIADYSAELIPELLVHFRVDVIQVQEQIAAELLPKMCGVKTAEWFLKHAAHYDRVLYHFGNSPYHQRFFQMLEAVPGVVVVHDFYLADLQYYREAHLRIPNALSSALYLSHGYPAVKRRYDSELTSVIRDYPASFEVFKKSLGVIVHSRFSHDLARTWYGDQVLAKMAIIPLLRVADEKHQRSVARKALGLAADNFVVCSFGMLGHNKLNHLLLAAWEQSSCANNGALLVFVGENQDNEYGQKIKRLIADSPHSANIRVTGWANTETFRNYLVAADLAVQLRQDTRGESSGAVFDCMNYGLATIVNANGSLVELPAETVEMLSENCTDNELAEAIDRLWHSDQRRAVLGSHAVQQIREQHDPQRCATMYAQALDDFHQRKGSLSLTSGRQLLLDVTITIASDLKTGIQRVVRALTRELILNPPPGWRVEPVYLSDDGGYWHYRYARHWTATVLLEIPDGWCHDELLETAAHDQLLLLDYTGANLTAATDAGLYARLKEQQISIHALIYDLLPVSLPECFPPCQFGYRDWLQAVSRISDSMMCISRSVSTSLSCWLRDNSPDYGSFPVNSWFHLGADLSNSAPTRGMPGNAEQLLAACASIPTFLMVGTIEPRKGYLQVILAFDQLWEEGHDVQLVIVGKAGWGDLPDSLRRTIPETVQKLKDHPQQGGKLHWLNDASDEYLEHLYAAADCLIAASKDEGFGLPLIEAAQHGVPLLIRDIPVFREVAGDHATYFADHDDPETLALAIKNWLTLWQSREHPRSETMPRLSWQQSAAMLKERLNL